MTITSKDAKKIRDEVRQAALVIQAERNRKWRAANPEASRESCRKWQRENPEDYRLSMRLWKFFNREKVRQYNREWRARNPDYFRARRARLTITSSRA